MRIVTKSKNSIELDRFIYIYTKRKFRNVNVKLNVGGTVHAFLLSKKSYLPITKNRFHIHYMTFTAFMTIEL